MAVTAQVAALVCALAYIGAAPFEMFLVADPRVQRFLHVEHRDVADVRLWSFCVGARNAIAGIGAVVGLVVLHTGDPTVGRTIVLTACAYMLLASLAMAAADLLGFWRPRGGSTMGTIATSAPALLALALA